MRDFADLYGLRFEDLAPLFAPKAKKGESLGARNLLAEIEASSSRELRRLLFGLGIRFVGERAAMLLARHFRSLEALAAAVGRGDRRDLRDRPRGRASRSTTGSASPRTRSSSRASSEAGVRTRGGGGGAGSLASSRGCSSCSRAPSRR